MSKNKRLPILFGVGAAVVILIVIIVVVVVLKKSPPSGPLVRKFDDNILDSDGKKFVINETKNFTGCFIYVPRTCRRWNSGWKTSSNDGTPIPPFPNGRVQDTLPSWNNRDVRYGNKGCVVGSPQATHLETCQIMNPESTGTTQSPKNVYTVDAVNNGIWMYNPVAKNSHDCAEASKSFVPDGTWCQTSTQVTDAASTEVLPEWITKLYTIKPHPNKESFKAGYTIPNRKMHPTSVKYNKDKYYSSTNKNGRDLPLWTFTDHDAVIDVPEEDRWYYTKSDKNWVKGINIANGVYDIYRASQLESDSVPCIVPSLKMRTQGFSSGKDGNYMIIDLKMDKDISGLKMLGRRLATPEEVNDRNSITGSDISNKLKDRLAAAISGPRIVNRKKAPESSASPTAPVNYDTKIKVWTKDGSGAYDDTDGWKSEFLYFENTNWVWDPGNEKSLFIGFKRTARYIKMKAGDSNDIQTYRVGVHYREPILN